MTGMEHAIERADSLDLARTIVESAIRDALHAVTDGTYHRSEQTDEEVWNAANDALRCLDSEHLLAPAPLTEEWTCRYTLKSGKVRTRQEETEREAREWFGTGRSTIIRRHVTAWELHETVDRAEGDGRADQ